jgi:3-oxoacyl-(acyl-carrier-protein) synthase
MIYLTHARTAYSEVTELFEDAFYPQRVHWFPEAFNRLQTKMFYVPHRVADKVLDPELCTFLRENPVGKTAFILAGGNQHFAGIQRTAKTSRLAYEYRFLPFTLTQVYAGRIGQQMGAHDLIQTDATACVSSLKVLMDTEVLMKHYGFDRVIVLTVEDAVSDSVLEFFGESGASLTLKQEQEGVIPSAFDEKNRGFYVGQGAALAVFESDRAVKVTGVTPIARLCGAYTASENCSNAIGQREDGEGYVKAIWGALAQTQYHPDRLKIVKTHGTGTPSNNQAEKTALERCLPGGFIATSFKPKIGHTMGASGLLESAMLFESISRGVVPAIPNRTQNDSVFLSQDTAVPDGLVLSLAAGMGNVYSAAIFEVN